MLSFGEVFFSNQRYGFNYRKILNSRRQCSSCGMFVDKPVFGMDLTSIHGSSNLWSDLERISWSCGWSPCSNALTLKWREWLLVLNL